MLLVASFVIAVVTVPLFGGRLSDLADAPFQRGRLLALALGLQILVISVVPGGPRWLWSAVHMATYGLLALVVLANRHLSGMGVIALGGASNLTAMLVNGGVMPATRRALRTAGLAAVNEDFVNSGIVDEAKLAFLGDIFAIPASWPLANVFSIGDVLIALGGWLVILALCRPSRSAARSADRRAEPVAPSMREGGASQVGLGPDEAGRGQPHR